MKINSINSVALRSIIDSIYSASDNSAHENKVNLKEAAKGAVVEEPASKDGFSQNVEKLLGEERVYRGAKPFKNVLASALVQDLDIPDDVYTFFEKANEAASPDGHSAGTGYYITMPDNAGEESAQSIYNEISNLYDPSLRFSKGRLVNILV